MYLGTLGRMIKIKCPTALRDSRSGGFAFSTTLEGKVKAQVLPGDRRVWDVELGQLTKPEDLRVLEQFTRGTWGPGPFMFVPTDALVTNMLTPQAADCDPEAGLLAVNASDGPMLTPDGWAARSIRRREGQGTIQFGTVGSGVPVLPGQSVTAAAYVRGDSARVQLLWLDDQGKILGTMLSQVRGTTTDVIRSHVTGLPPTGAISCRVQVMNGVQATWPTVTWTDSLVGHSPGQGCQTAVVHDASKDVTRATDKQQFYSAGFTVTEVG